MKPGKSTWLILLGSHLLALIYLAPASLIGSLLQSISAGRAGLANCSGTIWHGTATPVLYSRNGNAIPLLPLHWHVSLADEPAFRPQLSLTWEGEAQASPMLARLTMQGIEFRQIHLPLSASLIGEVSEFIKPAGLRGRILVSGESFFIGKQGLQGSVSADWLNASSLLSNIAPLGNYHLRFTALAAGGLGIDLQSRSGALQLTGHGQLLPGNGLEFHGTAQAAKNAEDKLQELLGHLGPESSPGVHTFTLTPSPAK